MQQYDMGLADLGFVGATRSPLIDYEVMDFECLCAMPAEDPLAGKECVTAADLDGQPMSILYADHPTFTHTKAAFDEMGARLNVRFETVYFIPMFTYIERGLAYAVVDPMSAESYKLFSGGDPRIRVPAVSPDDSFDRRDHDAGTSSAFQAGPVFPRSAAR